LARVEHDRRPHAPEELGLDMRTHPTARRGPAEEPPAPVFSARASIAPTRRATILPARWAAPPTRRGRGRPGPPAPHSPSCPSQLASLPPGRLWPPAPRRFGRGASFASPTRPFEPAFR